MKDLFQCLRPVAVAPAPGEKKRKASQLEEEDEMLPPLQKDGVGMEVDDIDTPKNGKRRTKEEMRGREGAPCDPGEARGPEREEHN